MSNSETDYPYFEHINQYLNSEFKCKICNRIYIRKDVIGKMECRKHTGACQLKETDDGIQKYIYSCCDREHPFYVRTVDDGCKRLDHHDGHLLSEIEVPLYFIVKKIIQPNKENIVQRNIIKISKINSKTKPTTLDILQNDTAKTQSMKGVDLFKSTYIIKTREF